MKYKLARKVIGGILALFAAFVLLHGTTANAYAQDWNGGNRHSDSGFAGGMQLVVVPSVDYLKSAFMQNFNYFNDVSFANKTSIQYASSQANESYSQGLGPFYGGGSSSHGNTFDSSFGVNALFMWLAGLFNGGFGTHHM